jgi:hypothetical protein
MKNNQVIIGDHLLSSMNCRTKSTSREKRYVIQEQGQDPDGLIYAKEKRR